MKEDTGSKQVLRLLFWETTIKCNLACAHCRRLESDEAAVRDLTTAQANSLIEQLAELGKGQFKERLTAESAEDAEKKEEMDSCFRRNDNIKDSAGSANSAVKQPVMPMLVFSGGEPLCREDLFELVSHAGSLGIIPALATNGTLIDAETAERIHDSGIVRVAVSLDGATAEVHNKLRKLEGCFEKAIEGIGHLRDKNVPFQINVTLTKHNAGQLGDIYELARSLGAVAVHIFMLVPVGCGQKLAETDMLSPQQYEQKLVEICRLEGRGELQVKVTCGPHYERVVRQKQLPIANRKSSRGCLAGLGVLFVGHQGDVYPCGYLPVRCGNILKDKLKDIWYKNKDLARMRDSDKLEGKCGICGYRQVCGGCRGRAYAATGNYMAEEPFCAYVPPEIRP